MRGIQLQGPRLPYVVRKLNGTVPVTKRKYNKRTGKVESFEEKEDAGYIVFYPRGHYLRIRNLDALKFYGLDKKPRPIAADGMQLHPTMRIEDAYENLEADVVEAVRSAVGQITIPGFDGKLDNLPKRKMEESYA